MCLNSAARNSPQAHSYRAPLSLYSALSYMNTGVKVNSVTCHSRLPVQVRAGCRSQTLLQRTYWYVGNSSTRTVTAAVSVRRQSSFVIPVILQKRRSLYRRLTVICTSNWLPHRLQRLTSSFWERMWRHSGYAAGSDHSLEQTAMKICRICL